MIPVGIFLLSSSTKITVQPQRRPKKNNTKRLLRRYFAITFFLETFCCDAIAVSYFENIIILSLKIFPFSCAHMTTDHVRERGVNDAHAGILLLLFWM